MLIALPFVATAAASAHKMMSETTAIEAPASVVAADSVIGVQRIHNVTLNRNGAIEGRIASLEGSEGISNLNVFLVRDGKIAQQATTNETGTFELAGVPEGAYSFVATGENGFAAYGVNVVANDGSRKVNVMEAAAVSPKFAVVQKILEGNLPQQVADAIISSTKNETAAKMVGSNRVQIKEGTLVGHVVPLLGDVAQAKGTYVHIIQNDKAIAEVQADETGFFQVSDLEPGVYDFVAAGPSGFAAVSFEAIAQEEIADSLTDSEEIPVSIVEPAIEPYTEPAPIYQDMISTDIPYDGGGMMDMGAPAQSLDVCMTCQGDNGFVGEQLDYAGSEVYADQGMSYDSAPIEYAAESVGCGGACGGSCGGAADFSGYSACSQPASSCGCSGRRGLFGGGLLSGAGGGGGLSRLLLLGGVAGAIVAIADDGDPSTSDAPN